MKEELKLKRLHGGVKIKNCCDFGEYRCQVPMPIAGRRYDIDICIADIIAALNAANIETAASCCGHDKIDGNIMLSDGREIIVKNCKRVKWLDYE